MYRFVLVLVLYFLTTCYTGGMWKGDYELAASHCGSICNILRSMVSNRVKMQGLRAQYNTINIYKYLYGLDIIGLEHSTCLLL